MRLERALVGADKILREGRLPVRGGCLEMSLCGRGAAKAPERPVGQAGCSLQGRGDEWRGGG